MNCFVAVALAFAPGLALAQNGGAAADLKFTGAGAYVDRSGRNATIASPTIPVIDLTGDTVRDSVVAEGTATVYQGHPTTVTTEDGRIIVVWCTPHGGHCGPAAESSDGGRTWTRIDDRFPAGYSRHVNCPSIYRLVGPDGKSRLWVWSEAKMRDTDGATDYQSCRFDATRSMPSVMSEDDGLTWQEVAPLGEKFLCVMAFTSIVRLKDGSYLGVFHTGAECGMKNPRRVWQSITTDGGFTWSDPELICYAANREACEPYVFRSPDGNELCCLMRDEKHNGRSMMIFSQNEGQTWTSPVDTPWGLTGDRHQGVTLPDGRLVIAFRDRALESTTAGDFVAWVGTYEELRTCTVGDSYRLRLLRSYDGVDCGYPGIELVSAEEEMITATTYIKYWNDSRKQSVVAKRFSIAEVEGRLDRMMTATVTGATGPANGRAYSCALSMIDPATGWTATWYDENGGEVGATAPSYAAEGVYTNVVKVSNAGYLDFTGTGVVTVTHYDPPEYGTTCLTLPVGANVNGVDSTATFATLGVSTAYTYAFSMKNPRAQTSANGRYYGHIMGASATNTKKGSQKGAPLVLETNDTTDERYIEVQTWTSSGAAQCMTILGYSASNTSWSKSKSQEVQALEDGEWHDVVFTYDATAQHAQVFVDGVKLHDITSSNLAEYLNWCDTTLNNGVFATPSTSGKFCIGRNAATTDNFAGSLSNVSVWNRALSAEEAVAISGSRLAGNESGLVLYWPLDGETGEVTAYDRQTNGTAHDGTVYSAGTTTCGTYWEEMGTKVPMIVATVTGATGPANGTAYSCALDVTDPASGYTALWAWTDAEDFTHDAPNAYTEEGVYTNVVKVTAEDYLDFYGTGVVTIAAVKPVTVSWGGTALTYSGAAQAPVATLAGVAAGADVTPVISGSETAVGSGYTATVTGLAGADAALYELSGTPSTQFSISAKPVTVAWGETTFYYTGNPQVPTATAVGVIGSEEVTVMVEGAQTEIGTGYTATATDLGGAGAGNYVLSGTLTTSFEIKEAAAGIYVATTGHDDTGDGSSGNPYATIAKAITEAKAAGGGTVFVETGTYAENNLVLDAAIEVIGIGATPDDVIISKSGNVVTLSHDDAVLKDVTVASGGGTTPMVSVSKGLIDHCVIRNSTRQTNYQGQALTMTGGRITRSVVRNCTTYGEQQKTSAIKMSNAKMDNCLVRDNSNAFSHAGTATVNCGSGCTIVNCTFAVNNKKWLYGTTPTLVNCLFFVSDGVTSGTANVTVGGTDANEWAAYFDSNTDYRPLVSCTTVIDCGSDDAYPDWASSLDLDGKPRKSGVAVDVGCQELDMSHPIVSGAADSYGITNGTTSVFTAEARGGSGSFTYRWDFGDDSSETTSEGSVEHLYGSCGLYQATVAVSDDGGDTWSDPVPLATRVVVAPKDIYVNAYSQTPQFPYDAPDKAAVTFAEGYGCLTNGSSSTGAGTAVDGVTIHVATGPYTGSGYVLMSGVTILGEGEAVFDGNGGYRVFTLDNANAALKKLEVKNGKAPSSEASGAGVYMTAGLIEDCKITDCGSSAGDTSRRFGKGGGVFASGGRISRTIFTKCSVTAIDSGNDGSGAALYLQDGAICENSLFTDNVAGGHNNGTRGGTVYVTGSGTRLINCSVVNNQRSGDGRAMPYTGIVQASSAQVINCVACSNGTQTVATRLDVYGTANCFVNSVWGRGNIDSPCAVDAAAFRNYANGNYRPAGNGVLKGAGVAWADYLGTYGATSLTDLSGKPRKMGPKLDIGCYATRGGLLISVR